MDAKVNKNHKNRLPYKQLSIRSDLWFLKQQQNKNTENKKSGNELLNCIKI